MLKFGDSMEKKRLIVLLFFIMLFITGIVSSSIYYNNKYSVYFETGTSEVILTQYVSKNQKIEKPIDPKKEGYIFKEWQCNGKAFDFNTKVDEDIVLSAKWIKKKYVTIKFNTNIDEKIDDVKIMYGDIIDNLPVITREDYEFLGWYLNDELYNGEEIYYDIELVAKYKKNIVEPAYKVGDKVKIIGSYSKSAYSLNAYNHLAIGWEREILRIMENENYPYVVGNSEGVTGFFKSSAIEKIEE